MGFVAAYVPGMGLRTHTSGRWPFVCSENVPTGARQLSHSPEWLVTQSQHSPSNEDIPGGNTRRLPDVGLMSAQRRRRRAGINPTLGGRIVFAGITTKRTVNG